MKKSLHSLLTAAMFAAAVTTSAGGLATAPNASAAPAEDDLTRLTETEPQDVYGPPSWFSETEPAATTTENPFLTAVPLYGPPSWEKTIAPITDTTTTTRPIMTEVPLYGPPRWDETIAPVTDTTTTTMPIMTVVPLYGPPSWDETIAPVTDITTTTMPVMTNAPLYGPPWVLFEKGDINYDKKLNAADLSLLKRAVLNDSYDEATRRLGDLNEDGKLDKADVKEMIRRLTGAPEKDPDETDVTTTATDATVPPRSETTTDPYLDIPMPLYGPPTAY